MMDIKDFREVWNAMHIKCCATNPETRNEIMGKWLEDQIIAAKAAYYNTESPLMEDNVYDKMEEYLRMINPDSPVLEKVGS